MSVTTQRKRSSAKVDCFSYFLRKIDADFGVGFHLKKAGTVPNGEESEYDINIDLARGYHSCTCKGNTYRGHCKHVESVFALIKAGKIAVPQQVAPEPIAFDDP